MRRLPYRLGFSLGLALAISGFAFTAANAYGLNCAVGVSVHNHARIVLKGQTLATCASATGCKCVSCYDFAGAPTSTCYPLVVAMPK
jgi:hypothetical protein